MSVNVALRALLSMKAMRKLYNEHAIGVSNIIIDKYACMRNNLYDKYIRLTLTKGNKIYTSILAK